MICHRTVQRPIIANDYNLTPCNERGRNQDLVICPCTLIVHLMWSWWRPFFVVCLHMRHWPMIKMYEAVHELPLLFLLQRPMIKNCWNYSWSPGGARGPCDMHKYKSWHPTWPSSTITELFNVCPMCNYEASIWFDLVCAPILSCVFICGTDRWLYSGTI